MCAQPSRHLSAPQAPAAHRLPTHRCQRMLSESGPIVMTESTPQGKKCPDCGQTVNSGASLCRHCGYDFLSPTTGVVPHEPQTQAGIGEATCLLLPRSVIIGISAVVLLLILMITSSLLRPKDPMASWETARALPHAQSTHDPDFEQELQKSIYLSELNAQVMAYDGLLLIHLSQTWPPGFVERFAGKAPARLFASLYSSFRQLNGESTKVTCVVYVCGRRFSQGVWPPPGSP